MNLLRFHSELLFIILILSSCNYFRLDTYNEVIQRPYYDWNYRDELIVMSSPLAHNLFDNRTNIKIMVTPYYPSVILAIQRNAQRKYGWAETEFRLNTDVLFHEALGMFYEWDTRRVVDCRGNYLKDKCQFDSLLVLISIENKGWPSYIPDITYLEDRIYLVNENNKFIKPKYVWGKKKNILIFSETLLAMFCLREGEYHFLEGSKEMYIAIKGFESDQRLILPLSMMR